ncbi:MAG: ABC transporter substrate-binding protein [bacterium]
MKRYFIVALVAASLALTFASLSYGERQFNGAWPYEIPPVGHFNTFVPRNISLGIYWDLMEQPLAMYYWSSDKWMPLLATSWELIPPDKFKVNLRRGVKWQDGTEFTANDVYTTFALGYLMNWAVWKYIDTLEFPDNYTVIFHMGKPSTVVPRYILRERIRSSSTYGKYADRVMALMAQGKGRDSEEMKNLRVEFDQFKPDKLIGTGPFMIDYRSITEAEITLVKFKDYWDAGRVKFDKIRLVNGETPVVTPQVLAKEVDYATHGFPPATEKQFVEEGIRIIRPPIYSGPAIFVNYNIYPLSRVEVRQAMAYAINREENAYVSLGKSAIAQKYMAGFSDNILPLWISPSDQEKLNQYPYNPAKAESILKGIGFIKRSDGVWVDDKGNRMEYELTVPAEYADWSAAAENAAEQLTKFGIKTTVRGVTFTQHPTEVNNGRFQMAIRGWGAGHPHPHFSFYQDVFVHNYVSGMGPGMNFQMKQKTKVLGEVDFEKEVIDSAEGLDEKAQKAKVTRVALAFNEVLPIIPLWERYGNNPALENVRVKGWPPEGDPIYKNSPYADSFIIMMILDGTLHP